MTRWSETVAEYWYESRAGVDESAKKAKNQRNVLIGDREGAREQLKCGWSITGRWIVEEAYSDLYLRTADSCRGTCVLSAR